LIDLSNINSLAMLHPSRNYKSSKTNPLYNAYNGLPKVCIKLPQDDTLVMSDLRMGAECFYAFNFTVGQRASPDSPWQPGTYAQTTERPDLATLGLIWDRIFDPTVDLSPPQPCPRDFKE
jgi:hypothetical protein